MTAHDLIPPPTEAAALRYAVDRLSRRLRKQVDSGLTASRSSLLATVERHGVVSMARLRAIEQTGKSTLTRLVAGLESEGYLARRIDPEDGRGFVVSLTEAGRRTLHEATRVQDEYLTRQLAALDDDDRAKLSEAIHAIEKLLALRA